MTKSLLCLLCALCVLRLASQPFGNEWINYDQKYYYFPVAATGVYRITFQNFTAAGIPISLVDPAHIQIWARGKQVPLYLADVSDGSFNATDYIEFIAEENDGRLDTELYANPADQGNASYSLFNDTIRYYLTFNTGGGSLRVNNSVDTNFDAYTPQDYCWFRSELTYNAIYHDQPSLLDVPSFSDLNLRFSISTFAPGEGWLSPRYGLGNPTSLTAVVPTPLAYVGQNAPPAEAETVVVGVSDLFGTDVDHHVQVRYGTAQTLVVNQQWNGYRVWTFPFDIPAASLGGINTPIIHQANNSLGLTRDDQAVARTRITYARQPNLQGSAEFRFEYRFNQIQSKTRFDLENVGGTNPRIYTLSPAAQRVALSESAPGSFRGLLANELGVDQYPSFLATDESVRSILPIETAANNGFFTNFGQTAFDSAFVIVTNASLLASAQQYVSYRQQRYNTVLANVDELYDQFGSGVPQSGLAIRKFANYLLQTWPSRPSHLLLLGKSVRTATLGNLTGSRKNTLNYSRNLVPSFGYPPSDNYFTAGLVNTQLEPAIPTGRVSAQNEEEVLWYLNKLMSFEGQEHALWMKNIMHFGGGTTLLEQGRFANYLSSYEVLAEDSSFAGVVYPFLKSGSEPIQINATELIDELIDGQGVSLMTFFAHAGSEGFDQSIDDPSNFDWNGKHPFLLGNGCFTGDYHNILPTSTSEKYTMLDGKGVIGFLASADQGVEGDLNAFSRAFYRNFARDAYGLSVGQQIKQSIMDVQSNTTLRRHLCYGMGLQGDPGLVLNSFPFPDLSVKAQDVYFSPEQITAEIDSFTVNIVIENLARGTYQSFAVSVEHDAPEGGRDSIYVFELPGLLYSDTVQFKIAIDPQFGLGLHRFNVFVDLPQNDVRELDGFESSNNQVIGKELLISNGGIVPIYPYPYAVVSEPNQTLQASTGDPLAPLRTYRIEIDTTDTFNSPLLQTTEISQIGGVVSWLPALAYPDSAVYYWRCRVMDNGEAFWRESSFQYIGGQRGWGQADFYQFKNDNFFQTEFNRPERKIDFFNGTVTLQNNVIGNSASFLNNIVLNFTEVEYGACFSNPSIHLAVFDPITFEAWGTNAQGQNPQNDFGNVNAGTGCRQRVEYYFIFRQQEPDQMQALADLLLSETIPDGHYVVLYSLRYVSYDLLDATPDIYDAFAELGAQTLGSPNAVDSVPFSIIARKGDPNFAFELYGDTINSVLNNSVAIPAAGSRGSVASSRIGPATQWNRASWLARSYDEPAGDRVEMRLFGIAPGGTETQIELGSIDNFNDSVDLGELVSAAEFPMLRFEAFLEDTVNVTPAQLDRWHIIYAQVPEAALDPEDHFVFKASELQQGEEAFISVAIANVSEFDMDSLLVHYWIEDENRQRIDIPYPRQDSLRVGEVLSDTVYFDTQLLSGRNVLWVEVNPRPLGETAHDQPEQTHFNNLLNVGFDVTRDEVNPLLDVSFDGIHIINGEIVSPQPEIRVVLKDENPYLIMDELADTSLFRVFLAEPNGSLQRRYFQQGEGEMQFIPADGIKNRAQIRLQPQFAKDGMHTLVVQAQDKSGNSSGNIDYRIEFEVINRSSITEVLNYPNPFSTSTQFVFTLTGSQVPDEFKIQIMTVSGKVVREVFGEEFGPIRIGRNISTFRWDGRDEYGDRLANGVYIYRVIARINGESIEKMENGASQYFTKSYGKMVMFR